MENQIKVDDTMVNIIQRLSTEAVDISELCDLIYHYNKSLGLTYIVIRSEIVKLSKQKRHIALRNFLIVIREMKSPHLFIHVDEAADFN